MRPCLALCFSPQPRHRGPRGPQGACRRRRGSECSHRYSRSLSSYLRCLWRGTLCFRISIPNNHWSSYRRGPFPTPSPFPRPPPVPSPSISTLSLPPRPSPFPAPLTSFPPVPRPSLLFSRSWFLTWVSFTFPSSPRDRPRGHCSSSLPPSPHCVPSTPPFISPLPFLFGSLLTSLPTSSSLHTLTCPSALLCVHQNPPFALPRPPHSPPSSLHSSFHPVSPLVLPGRDVRPQQPHTSSLSSPTPHRPSKWVVEAEEQPVLDHLLHHQRESKVDLLVGPEEVVQTPPTSPPSVHSFLSLISVFFHRYPRLPSPVGVELLLPVRSSTPNLFFLGFRVSVYVCFVLYRPYYSDRRSVPLFRLPLDLPPSEGRP